MVRVDSYQPLTAETQVRTQDCPHVICGEQGGTETGFSQYFGFPPRQ